MEEPLSYHSRPERKKEKHMAARLPMSLPNGNEARFENGQAIPRRGIYVCTYNEKRDPRTDRGWWLRTPDDGSRSSADDYMQRGRGKFSVVPISGI